MILICILIFLAVAVPETVRFIGNIRRRHQAERTVSEWMAERDLCQHCISCGKGGRLRRSFLDGSAGSPYISCVDEDLILCEKTGTFHKGKTTECPFFEEKSPEPRIAGFESASHVRNFIRYLARTDTRQKWTNKRTESSLYWIHSADGSETLFSGSESQRKRAEEVMLIAISGIQYQELKAVEIILPEDADPQEARSEAEADAAKLTGGKPLVTAYHTDERAHHVHIICRTENR